MLTRVYADNFRCLINFECRLQERQLFVGANGSGKTTVFDVLALLRDICVRGDSLVDSGSRTGEPEVWRICGRTKTRWTQAETQVFEIDVEGNGGTYRLFLEADSWGTPPKPRIVREEVRFDEKPIFLFAKGVVHLYNDNSEDKVQYPFDWHRSALATITDRWDNTKLSWFKRWLDGLLIVSPDPHRMSGIAAKETRRLDQSLSNFADWYSRLRHEMGEEELYGYTKALADVFDGFKGMRLEDAGERRLELKALFSSTEGGNGGRHQEYLLDELSEGQRVLIGLYGILHFAMREGRTVCFDEPANYISLHEVKPWLSEVMERTEDDPPCQVLVASHHPELLNRMAFKEGLLLDRPSGRHVRCRPFTDPQQTGLTASELVVRGWESE